MLDLSTAKVTTVQFFSGENMIQIDDNDFESRIEYSANVVINDKYLVQLSGCDDEAHKASIPDSFEQCWNDEDAQGWFAENVSICEIEDFLEDQGIENNHAFLSGYGE